MDRTQNASEQQGDCVQPLNCPTQANTGLEWATHPHISPLKIESEGGPHNAMFVVWVSRRILNWVISTLA
jgi:hypothetical protein